MRKLVRVLVGVLCALGVATGCGGGTDVKSSSSTVAKTGPSTTTASSPAADRRSPSQLASDKAEADRVVLRLTDLPPRAWNIKPDRTPDSPEKEAADERFRNCVGIDPALFVGSRGGATAKSDEFVDEEDHRVKNSITLVSSRERGAQQLAALKRPEFPGCFETYMTEQIQSSEPGAAPPPGVTLGTPRVVPFNVPGLNTDSVAYRATVPVTAKGQTVDVGGDTVIAFKGRTGIKLTFDTGDKTPFPPDLETSLTNKVIDRAPAK